MTILVTGATGFVGSAVVRRLLELGTAVRVLVRSSSNQTNIRDLSLEIVTGDLRDPDSLTKAVAGCTGIYHVAADYRLWTANPQDLYRSNVEGTRNLLRAAAAADVERIVYTSSVATLGLHKDGSPADEDTPVSLEDMIGHYKRSKFLAEEEVRRLVREEHLPVVIVNPSAPVGPRDIKPTPTGRMILEATCGRMPAYVDTGLNLVHVDDVAKGHILAFRHGRIGERYILGGQNMRLKDILNKIAILVDHPPPRICLPHNLILPIAYLAEAWARLFRTGEPFVTVDGVRLAKKRMFFSTTKAERELSYISRPPEQALTDAIDWFKTHGYNA